MKSILPGRFELVVFVVMASVAGGIVALSSQRDTMLFVMTVPIFLISAILGLRRSMVPVTVKSSEISVARNEPDGI